MIDPSKYNETHTLIAAINHAAEEDYFTVLDTEVAAAVLKVASPSLTAEQRNWIAVAVALCHRRTRTGHSHLDLTQPQPGLAEFLGSWPENSFWQEAFSHFRYEDEKLPIVWEPPGFLYLRRLWKYEHSLTHKLALRAHQGNGETMGRQGIDSTLLKGCSPEQIQAIEAVCRKSVVLLSGGPGTGKTFTVLRCIAALLSLNPETRIALLAPTGKAVARLTASVTQGIEALPVSEEIKSRIPTTASTIHRFLNELDHIDPGIFVPIPAPAFDWVFVDEVSMVDLRLMKRLLGTIPDTCRLFMLGDVHQLASVEPGSVFSDFYHAVGESDLVSTGFQTIELQETFRFSADSSIYRLCEAVRTGDHNTAQALLAPSSTDPSLLWNAPNEEETNRKLDEWIITSLFPALLNNEPEKALTAFARALLLCATNRGPFGVETLNRSIRRRIEGECRKHALPHYWSPVLITQNDYRNELFNGDVGLQRRSLHGAETAGQVVFKRNNELRTMNPSQLPAHADAFAMTIHKSQGSEAENVMVLLPEADSPILTRELLYTAISRAKSRLHLIASKEAVNQTIRQCTQRDSRLGERLRDRLSIPE